MFRLAFQFHLSHNILPGLVTVGKFDGEHPSLVCGTKGGKVFLHSPHEVASDEHRGAGGSMSGLRFLNINQEITALAAGTLDQSKHGDVLLIGTHASLQAYNVEENADIFFKDVPDGVNVIRVGYLADLPDPLAFVGGNCTVQGFNSEGNEVYWTVTGDNVGALALVDVNWDDRYELLVGSDDYNIRIFSNDEVVGETTESDAPIHLCPLRDAAFGYALADGTIGTVNGGSRPWRRKTKHRVTALHSFDLDGDGAPELIIGWDNGRFEVRRDTTGDLIYKDMFPASVSGIVDSDYRMDGVEEVVCCAFNGEIRGYVPKDEGGDMPEQGIDTESETALAELLQRRSELETELRAYEENVRRLKDQKKGGTTHTSHEVGTIPVTTTLDADVGFDHDGDHNALKLFLETNNDQALVHGVVVYADQVFRGESLLRRFAPPQRAVNVRLPARVFVSGTLRVKALVGLRAGQHYHVFESEHMLPRFAMFMPITADQAALHTVPTEGVTMRVSERVRRVDMWMRQVFLVDAGLPQDQPLYDMDEWFLNLDNKSVLRLVIEPNDPQGIHIMTTSIATAAEIVQDMCAYLKITELNTVAVFPHVETELAGLLQKVEDYNAVRMRMTADMADLSNLVKALVVQAEDARLLGNMATMRKAYVALRDVNRDLVAEHAKRAANQQELLACLRVINQYIQRSSQCRVGEPQARVVAMCRAAVKAGSVEELLRVVRLGAPKA